MKPRTLMLVVAGYFGLLMIISNLTSNKSKTSTFFNADKNSPWYLVAFGMIGASLSGVTFISVPGWVKASSFYYFQMVLGYLAGYYIIANVLLPIYYKKKLVSIYQYLADRFGQTSHKTGSAYFIVSRIIGASLRLFLVAQVLQLAFFGTFNVPFGITVGITIILIWIYTHKAGIKTIVWTDTLQTTFMLLAVIATIVVITNKLNINLLELKEQVTNSKYSTIFNWDWHSPHFFVKDFLSGMFITLAMTGLDQDMMQKNLTVRTLKESKKNMLWFSISLVPVNLLFLFLGASLYIFADKNGIAIPSGDMLFPTLALKYLGGFAAITFLIGIIAAAFSSADSALTALTTSISIDFLNLNINSEDKKTKLKKNIVHIAVSLTTIAIILIFKAINNDSVIKQLFTITGYTYGPLLGMFAFGIFTKYRTKDKFVPVVAVLSPVISFFIAKIIEHYTSYQFGFELLILNGTLTFFGLWTISDKKLND